MATRVRSAMPRYFVNLPKGNPVWGMRVLVSSDPIAMFPGAPP